MDDFVRNFMVRMGLTGTLEKFETEWYEMEATGKLNKEDMGAVPDVYNYNQELNDQCVALRREVNAQKAVVEKATSTWEKFRKERDVHRMHHKRIGQEKNKLLGDIKKLRKHYAQYEPTIKELKRKYEQETRTHSTKAVSAKAGLVAAATKAVSQRDATRQPSGANAGPVKSKGFGALKAKMQAGAAAAEAVPSFFSGGGSTVSVVVSFMSTFDRERRGSKGDAASAKVRTGSPVATCSFSTQLCDSASDEQLTRINAPEPGPRMLSSVPER